jgi:hypothetical protein
MPFWEFSQNNSGGSFDKKMGHSIYVEADSADEANSRAEGVGVYFNGCVTGGDCPCCGDRWHAAYGDPDVTTLAELRDEIEMRLPYAKGWNLPINVLPKGQDDMIAVVGVTDIPQLAAPAIQLPAPNAA